MKFRNANNFSLIIFNIFHLLSRLTAIFGHEKGDWKNELGDSVSLVEQLPSPRFIKTHLPLELLPTQIHTVKPKVRKKFAETVQF